MAGATAMIGVSPAPAGRHVLAVDQDRLNLRHVAEARHPIARETRVENAPVGKLHALEQGPAQALDDRALHLAAHVVGVDHRAAVERLHHTQHLRLAVRPIDCHLHTRRHVGALVGAARQSDAVVRCRRSCAPAKRLRGSRQHGAQPRDRAGCAAGTPAGPSRVACASSSRKHSRGKGIGRRRQRTVRALAQRRQRGLEFDVLVGDRIGRFDARRPGVVVVELQRRQLPVRGSHRR